MTSSFTAPRVLGRSPKTTNKMAYFPYSIVSFLLLIQCCLFPARVFAGFEETLVKFDSADGDDVNLAGAVIILDDSDPIGIAIAVNSLADDLQLITGQKPLVETWRNSRNSGHTSNLTSHTAIIAATADSPLIQQLETEGLVDVDDIRGKWETFRTVLVADPLPGVQNAFVIAGSDMRAVIYGVYTLSEQCGQSP